MTEPDQQTREISQEAITALENIRRAVAEVNRREREAYEDGYGDGARATATNGKRLDIDRLVADAYIDGYVDALRKATPDIPHVGRLLLEGTPE